MTDDNNCSLLSLSDLKNIPCCYLESSKSTNVGSEYDETSYSKKEPISTGDSYFEGFTSNTENKDNLDYHEYIVKNMKLINSIYHHLQGSKYSEQLKGISDKVQKFQIPDCSSIICFDLDETLIHTRTVSRLDSVNFKFDFSFDNFSNDDEITIGWIRPGVEELLSYCKSIDLTLCLFSAAESSYVDFIIEKLKISHFFNFVLSRDCCVNVEYNGQILYIKDLSPFNRKDILIVDNYIHSFASHLKHGILVNPFEGDEEDLELFETIDYLKSIILYGKIDGERNEEFFCFQTIFNALYMKDN